MLSLRGLLKSLEGHLGKDLTAYLEDFSSRHIPFAVAVLAAVLGAILFLKANTARQELKSEPTQQAKRSFTKSEIAEHNKESDVWIILRDKVYDVTRYVEEHPGGLAILRNAGRDSTEGFHGPQHPERVFDLIDDFYIGDLDKSES